MNEVNSERPRRGRWLQIAGVIAGTLILAFLVRQVWRDWSTVRTYSWSLRPGYLVGSMVALQLAFLIMARSWRSVLRAIGVRLHYTRAYWIFYLSNLGRYIPGNLWQMGAAAFMGRQLGLSPADMVASMIVHLLYFLPVGAAMALVSGGFPPPYDGSGIRMLAWALALASASSALWPNLVLRSMPGLAARLKLDPIRWKLETGRRLGIIVQTMAAWIFLSAGFALLVLAVTPVDSNFATDLARIYVVAHITGYVVLLAPAGLGVREGVMVVLLSPLVGLGPAAGMALLARLWFTLAELLAVGLSLHWLRRDRGTIMGVWTGRHSDSPEIPGPVKD